MYSFLSWDRLAYIHVSGHFSSSLLSVIIFLYYSNYSSIVVVVLPNYYSRTFWLPLCLFSAGVVFWVVFGCSLLQIFAYFLITISVFSSLPRIFLINIIFIVSILLLKVVSTIHFSLLSIKIVMYTFLHIFNFAAVDNFLLLITILDCLVLY